VKVNSLYFEWPIGFLKDPVSVVMILSNKTQQKVCFKVKTTPVKHYCVEPARGPAGWNPANRQRTRAQNLAMFIWTQLVVGGRAGNLSTYVS